MTLSKKIEEYRKTFFDLYYKDMLPRLSYYDKERKDTLFVCSIIVTITLITLIPAVMFFINSDEFRDFAPLLLLWLVPPGVASFKSYCFVTNLKENFYKDILPVLGNIKWARNADLGESIIRNSELFPKYNSYIVDDGFWGTYKNVAFRAIETVLTGEAGFTLFKGVILLFKSNKKVNNKTIIGAKKDRTLNKSKNALLITFYISLAIIFILLAISCFMTKNISTMTGGIICLILAFMTIQMFREENKKMESGFRVENMQEIKLEDSVFNKKFTAYSSDQVEGRYLITTAFMERLVHLQNIFGTKKIKCAFVDNIIIFAIPTNRNVFEIGNLFKPLTDVKTMERFFSEISAIYLLIDHFKLNEKTGL